MVEKPQYKEPTVKEKLDIRREFEKIGTAEDIRIIPTDLAVVILRYCYGIGVENFFDYSEAQIGEMALEAIEKLFLKTDVSKKK